MMERQKSLRMRLLRYFLIFNAFSSCYNAGAVWCRLYKKGMLISVTDSGEFNVLSTPHSDACFISTPVTTGKTMQEAHGRVFTTGDLVILGAEGYLVVSRKGGKWDAHYFLNHVGNFREFRFNAEA